MAFRVMSFGQKTKALRLPRQVACREISVLIQVGSKSKIVFGIQNAISKERVPVLRTKLLERGRPCLLQTNMEYDALGHRSI